MSQVGLVLALVGIVVPVVDLRQALALMIRMGR